MILVLASNFANPPSGKLLYLPRNYIQTTRVHARKLKCRRVFKKNCNSVKSGEVFGPLETLDIYLYLAKLKSRQPNLNCEIFNRRIEIFRKEDL